MRIALAVACSAALVAAGCDAETKGELFVDVRTDLATRSEFSGVRTEVWRERPETGAPPLARLDHLVADAEPYATGVRVAELRGLDLGTYWVRVGLQIGAEVAVDRVASVRVQGPTTLTLLLTRDCAGVICPPPGGDPALTTCAEGRCVDPRCVPEGPEPCGEPACLVDGECDTGVACVESTCESGICMHRPDDARCAAGEHCDPAAGCEAPTELGDPCTDDAECDTPGASCTERAALLLSGPGGICTTPCCAGADCPMGLVCWTPPTGARACVPPAVVGLADPLRWAPCAGECTVGICRLEDVARGTDYFATTACGDPVGSGVAGASCTSSAECESALCGPIVPGSCTRPCGSTRDCGTIGGVDTICTLVLVAGEDGRLRACFPAGGGHGVTGTVCTSGSECRDLACIAGRCADTCCRDAHCPSGTTCRATSAGDAWPMLCR